MSSKRSIVGYSLAACLFGAALAVGGYEARRLLVDSKSSKGDEQRGFSVLAKRVAQLEASVGNHNRERMSIVAPSDATSTLLDDLDERLNTLAASLGDLRDRMTDLESQLGSRGSEREGLVEDQSSARAHRAEAAMQDEELLKRHFASLNRQLMQEEGDDQFGNVISTEMHNVMQEKPEWSAAQVSSMQCGTTLCRFELDFPADMDEIDRFELEHTLLAEFADQLPGGRMQVEYLAGGGQRLIAFMARQGNEIPPINEQQ